MKRALFIIVLAAACKGDLPSPASTADDTHVERSSSAAPDAGCNLERRALRRDGGARIVAVGDLHGDFAAARRALRLAGAIDANDRWIGGELIVVQTGDVLDRGDEERLILELFAQLRAQAAAVGGALITLNGNHELMNVLGDLRYVTVRGLAAFADLADDFTLSDELAELIASAPEALRSRLRAFVPGGVYARGFADNSLAAIVGDTVFVHGGILPRFAAGLEEADWETRCWLAGQRLLPPPLATDPEGPFWSRHYAADPPDCQSLGEALEILGVERMVVGHTTSLSGVRSTCEGRVWIVDTGMAAAYGGVTEVLEIAGDRVQVLGR